MPLLSTYLILSYPILSYLIKTVIEHLSQYWLVRGAFTAEAPWNKKHKRTYKVLYVHA